MIDEDFSVKLIEVNTNPCLETPCSLLQSLISSVIDQTFKLTLDPLYNIPGKSSFKHHFDGSNTISRFELVFEDETLIQ
jgi:tubulin---tyrosine ligase